MASYYHDNTNNNVAVNPMVPHTVGALLAEETMINYTSVLPSFLEHVMMLECRTSAWKTLHMIMDMTIRRLHRIEEDDSERRFVVARLLQRILKFLKLSKLLKAYHSHLRFLLVYWIQRKCLLHQNALVEEALYGCKRVRAATDTSHGRAKLQPMSKRDAIWLALLTSLGPYVQGQGSESRMLQRMLEKCTSKILSPEKQQRLHSMLYNGVVPMTRLIVKSAAWLQQWRFLMGRSIYFDLPSRFLNLVVRRVTRQDQQQQIEQTKSKNSDSTTSTLQDAMQQMANSKVKNAAIAILSVTMALSWIARIRTIRQEMRHRQDQGNDSSTNNNFPGSTSHKLIPPPPPAPNTSNLPFPNLPPSICPLCQEPRIHPTTTTQSNGYVFCYKCILRHVEEQGKCPASGKLCSKDDLVRLYEPHT